MTRHSEIMARPNAVRLVHRCFKQLQVHGFSSQGGLSERSARGENERGCLKEEMSTGWTLSPLLSRVCSRQVTAPTLFPRRKRIPAVVGVHAWTPGRRGVGLAVGIPCSLPRDTVLQHTLYAVDAEHRLILSPRASSPPAPAIKFRFFLISILLYTFRDDRQPYHHDY
jgi:hypothetical protein